MKPIDEEIEGVAYKCRLLLYNNVDNYIIGDSVLRHYYTVYDIDRYQIGIGKLAAAYDARYTPHVDGEEEEVVEDVDDQDKEKEPNDVVVDPNGDVGGEES